MWLEGKKEIDVLSRRTGERGESERKREGRNEERERGTRRKRLRGEGETKGARMHLLFVGKGPSVGPPLNAVSLISARWGPPIGHMKAKKPKVVVDLVLHRPLN